MAVNSRNKRPSFLRPLTQIAPQQNENNILRTAAELGPTTRGSIASAAYGARPRSKSQASVDGEGPRRHATPTSAIGTRSASGGGLVSSPVSASRRSSFAPSSSALRRPSMSAREPTSSRRSSVYAGGSFTFGDEPGVGPNGVELTEEEKALEAKKAFASAIKVLWESGTSKILTDLWEAVVAGWKSGDIVGLLSIDSLGLSRVDHARAVVLADDLAAELQRLAATSVGHPGTLKALRTLDANAINAVLDSLQNSPIIVALLLNSLESFSKLVLRTLPIFSANLALPDTLNPAFHSSINLVTFLAGSSTDLRKTLASAINLTHDSFELIENAARAIVAIVAQTPPPVLLTTLLPHPVGGFLFSPEHTLAQFLEIKTHIRSLLAQPAFVNILTVFQVDLKATGDGLVGNARVARAVRGAERIFRSNNPAWGLRDKFAAILDALDVAGWELTPIASDTDDFSYKFENLKPKIGELLPRDVAFSLVPGTAAVGSEGAPDKITLRNCKLVIPAAQYTISKKGGALAFDDQGRATIEVPFDIEIDFSSSTQKPEVLAKAGKPTVDLVSSSSENANGVSAALGKVWNAWLSSVVRSKLAESLEDRFDSAIGEWIEPLFAPSHAPVTAQGLLDRVASTARAPAASTMSPTPSQGSIKAGATAPVGPRAAFLQSLRMSSGVGERIRPLTTGRDVLETLSNPFSAPNSAADKNEIEAEEEDMLSDASGLRSRRMSMATSLTDLAMQDSTAIGNIENPPRAESVAAIEEEVEQPSMSLAARRLSLAYTPAGEHSLDAYDSEFRADAIDEYEEAAAQVAQGTAASLKHRRMSMADHLDERASVDHTLPENLIASAKKGKHGFDDHAAFVGSRENLSMARVTRDLQGREDEPGFEVGGAPTLNRTFTGDSIGTPSSQDAPHPQPYQKPIRRKSMSEYLTEASMADTTDVTTNPGSRAPPKEELVDLDHRPSMSSVLDHISSVDTTLPENIASPPRSRNSSFAPGAFTIAGGARNDTRTRTKSFMALDDVPTMSELGIDEKIARDETESATAGARRRSAAQEEYAGIDPAELKKRRMSSFMTEAASADATLLENIRSPSTVDQAYHEVAAQPHSLSARRQSTAGAS